MPTAQGDLLWINHVQSQRFALSYKYTFIYTYIHIYIYIYKCWYAFNIRMAGQQVACMFCANLSEAWRCHFAKPWSRCQVHAAPCCWDMLCRLRCIFMCRHASHQASADINFAPLYVYIQNSFAIFVWCAVHPLDFPCLMSTVHLAMSEEQPSSTSPQLGNQVRACISGLIERSDPAAQLPRSVVNHLSNSLLDLLGPRLPLLGGENRVEELLPLQVACPTCSSNLSKCYTLASDAVLVDVAAVIQKKHIPARCRNRNCAANGQLLWHNYLVSKGQHIFVGDPATLRCFMLTASFGFTVDWLQRFHDRMVRQHASFISEADLVMLAAERAGQSHLVPARLRLLISEAWFKWRLLLRLDDPQNINLRDCVEDLLQPVLPSFNDRFTASAVEQARAASMRLDVLVLDGNAKNRRAVCAALFAGSTHSKALQKTLRHTCPGTPKLGHLFCPEHATKDDDVQNEDWHRITVRCRYLVRVYSRGVIVYKSHPGLHSVVRKRHVSIDFTHCLARQSLTCLLQITIRAHAQTCCPPHIPYVQLYDIEAHAHTHTYIYIYT